MRFCSHLNQESCDAGPGSSKLLQLGRGRPVFGVSRVVGQLVGGPAAWAGRGSRWAGASTSETETLMTDMNPLAWIADAYETHCLTLAKGLTGHELLLRLGADPAETFTPRDDDEANGLLWAAGENYWSWGAARAGEANGWAFVLEPASCWGSIPEGLEHASRGTEVIFSSEVGGMGNVGYWQDGTRITGFDTMSPQDRAEQGQAADPDRLVEQM